MSTIQDPDVFTIHGSDPRGMLYLYAAFETKEQAQEAWDGLRREFPDARFFANWEN